MSTIRNIVISAVLFGAVLSSTAVANAWPIPITGEQQRFINTVRNQGEPGSDDEILSKGLRACNVLYTQHDRQAAIAISSEVIVRAARGILCTQTPG